MFTKTMDRTKKFVADHKVAIAVIITAAIGLKVNKIALRDHENFMAEHGILELFYSPELREI